jgi:hypothetical protein
VGRPCDLGAVGENLGAADGAGAVGAAERVREPEAGRRQRLEAERGQQPRRAGIPRVRNDECAVALVERAECSRFLCLGIHRRRSGIAQTTSMAQTSSLEEPLAHPGVDPAAR